jgi:hypothetical protein
MKGSKRMVPLEEVRASLLTIVTPEATRREGRRRGWGRYGRRKGDNSDGHGEGGGEVGGRERRVIIGA